MRSLSLVIITTLITLAACGGGDSTKDTTAVDLIVSNANGYSVNADGLQRFTTIVVDKGKIVAIGDAAVAKGYSAQTQKDVGGASVLPGLIDAHGHVASLGRLRATLDLAGINSLDTTLSRIDEYNRSLPDEAQWLTGRGWNQVLWTSNAFPTAADLDQVVKNRAVFLNRIDGHAGWANSRALELAGITDETPDPVGGLIVRDEDGKATGVLVDVAMSQVFAVIPPPSVEEQREYLRNAMLELATLGVTGVHDAGASPTEIKLYQQLADADQMAIRVSAMLGGMKSLEAFEAPIHAYGNDHLDVTSVKLYADGALGSRGAAMLEDYSDDQGNRGLLFLGEAQLAEQIAAAHAKGFAANVHAIGDQANQAALNAYELATGGKPSTLNNRIEHAQIITLEDIERFKTLNIVASFQPTHATSDMNMAEDRVGSERIKGAYAWRRLIDAGARLAAGSDFPVEKPEMFDGLYAAVTRQDKEGKPRNGWYPDQALTREETLAAFSLWAADSVGQADRLGSLDAGKWADFIIIDRDYFTIPAEQIWQIKVLETWVGGQQITATR